MSHFRRLKSKINSLALAAGWCLCVLGACYTPSPEAKEPQAGTGAGHSADSREKTPVSVPPVSRVLDLASLVDIDRLVEVLAEKQVVYIGEIHDRYEHHLNQLELIRRLWKRHPDLVIGLEFFQQPFQNHLDRYIDGEISEKEMLKRTEYFNRWRYDYRLYRPILRFAREKGIPLIALNPSQELSAKVAAGGLDALSDEERRQVPADIDRSDQRYREKLEAVFHQHPDSSEKNFEHFVEAQLLWDEGMAARAADYFRRNAEGHMVILAGSGHVEYGHGIPQRLSRRVPVSSAIVINGPRSDIATGLADFVLFTESRDLPRGGLMGVLLETDAQGVRINGFSDGSPAKEAGMKKGDWITRIGSDPVKTYADVRVALIDRDQGDKIGVEVWREHLLSEGESLDFEITLF